jgi:hypothetical protein
MEQIFRSKTGYNVQICSILEGDLDSADYVTRLAFGTFLGLPAPLDFLGDTRHVARRWKADPAAAFCANTNNELVGSVFASSSCQGFVIQDF